MNKRRRIPVVLVLALSILGVRVQGQDIHFAQFTNVPHVLTPADPGVFNGAYRFGAAFRQQWRSVTEPYRTFAFGIDSRSLLGVEGLGVGLGLTDDRAGDGSLRTTTVELGLAWTQPLSRDGVHALSAGIRGGFTARSVNSNAFRYDNQYNGMRFDPSVAHGEAYLRDAMGHGDVHTGLAYRYRASARRTADLGFAAFHLTRPAVSFFDASAIPLHRRYLIHASAQLPVGTQLDVLPSLLVLIQNSHREWLVGGALRHILLDNYGLVRAVRAGLHLRPGDATVVHAALEYDGWTVGLSYDINFSSLVPASRYRGGLELTAVYIPQQRRRPPVRFRQCPDHL